MKRGLFGFRRMYDTPRSYPARMVGRLGGIQARVAEAHWSQRFLIWRHQQQQQHMAGKGGTVFVNREHPLYLRRGFMS